MEDSSTTPPTTSPLAAQDLVDRRTTQGTQPRMAIERLVATLSSQLIKATSTGMAEELNWALRVIGEFAQVDRSYIHLLVHWPGRTLQGYSGHRAN